MKKYLDYEDFKSMVYDLSFSQGFYSRLYRDLLELEKEGNEESLFELKETINNLNATEELDFIYWLEC